MSGFNTVEENHTLDKLANSINYTFIFHGTPCHVVVSSLQCWQIVCKNPSSILRPQWAAESLQQTLLRAPLMTLLTTILFLSIKWGGVL